jgi:predicted MFS family arabinose efflux permease
VNGRSGWVFPSLLALAVDAVGILPLFISGAMAVQLRSDIGLQLDDLGLVSAAYFGMAALLSAPLGRVAERTGPEMALRVGTLMCVLSLAGIAALARSPLALIALVGFAGLGTALTRTAGSVLVSRRVVPQRQGLAFGLKHCSIPLGSLAAGAAVPAIALTVGWRWAFVLAAFLALVVALLVPRREDAPVAKTRKGRVDMPKRSLVIGAIGLGFGSSAASCLGVYTLSTAVDAGMEPGTAGILVALGSVVGICSRVAIGVWNDHRSGGQLDVVEVLLLVGSVGFLLLGLGSPAVLWFAVPLTFATGWSWMGSYTLAMVRLNPVAPGAAVGITQTGVFIGAVTGPLALGFIADHVSFTVAWSCAAAASLIAVSTTAWIHGFRFGRLADLVRRKPLGDEFPVRGADGDVQIHQAPAPAHNPGDRP